MCVCVCLFVYLFVCLCVCVCVCVCVCLCVYACARVCVMTLKVFGGGGPVAVRKGTCAQMSLTGEILNFVVP